jgi:hypothetical protein
MKRGRMSDKPNLSMPFALRSQLAELELIRLFNEDLDSFERMEAIDEAIARLAEDAGRTQFLATIGLLHAALDFHMASITATAADDGTKVNDILDALVGKLDPEASLPYRRP